VVAPGLPIGPFLHDADDTGSSYDADDMGSSYDADDTGWVRS
jgi:hypothetical protein